MALAAFGFPTAAAADHPHSPKVDAGATAPLDANLGVRSVDTYRAGEAVNLRIDVAKTPDHCTEVFSRDEWGTEYCGAVQEKEGDPIVDYARFEEPDFKKVVLRFEGFAPDINAALPCTPILNPLASDPNNEPEPGDPYLVCAESDTAEPVGEVNGTLSNCVEDYFPYDNGQPVQYVCGWGSNYGDRWWAWHVPIHGPIYMAEPRQGYQGRLVALIGGWIVPGVPLEQATAVYTDIAVEPDGTIVAITDDIPDYVDSIKPDEPENPLRIVQQADLIRETLFGDVGADAGHPLLANPTFCSAVDFKGEVQGYAFNPVPTAELIDYIPGHGEGQTVSISAPYNATNCEKVPYDPGFDISIDNPEPGAAPAITATVSQEKGEASSGLVKVVFPKGFQVNFDNKAGQCTRQEFEGNSCPDESKIGEAAAFSDLLPLDLEDRELRGSVYLGETDLAGGKIKLYVRVAHPDFLPDGIWLYGSATVQEDGSLVTVFDDLPELPMQKFTLSLDGGQEKSLMRNSKTCGQKTVKTTFTTHNGRELRRQLPLEISCTAPTFDVDLDTLRPRRKPTVSLSVAGPGIDAVGFDISRSLRVKSNPRALTSLARYGTLTLVTETGQRELKLKLLKGGGLGSLSFSATQGKSQVTSAGAYDVRLEGRAKRRLSSKARKRHAKGPTRLWIGRLPEGTTRVTLELEGSKQGFIRNPSRCSKRRGRRAKPIELGFNARIVGADGRRHVEHRSLKMSCGRRL